MLNEQLHKARMAILSCRLQRLLLDEEFHNVCVAMLTCAPHCFIFIIVHVCASSKKQLHCREVPAIGCLLKGHVQHALPVLGAGLKQRRAVLVNAGSHHVLEHCHVAIETSAHEASAARNPVNVVLCGRRITAPRLLLLQTQPRDVEGLVHARQASQLRHGQMAQHQEMCPRREGHNPQEQLRQLVGR